MPVIKVQRSPLLPVLLFLGLNVVALVVVAGGYWYWQYSLTQLLTNQAELVSLDKKIVDLSQLKRVMTETAADRAKLSAHFLTTDTLPDFIGQLESLATSTKVELKVTNVALETDGAPAVVLKFEVAGAFANIHRYIALINELPFQLMFTEAVVADHGGWAGKFTLRVLSFVKS